MIIVKQSINDPNELFVTGLSNNSRLHMFDVIKNDETGYYFNIFKNYTMPDSLKNNPNLYSIYLVDNDDWWDNISAHWYDTSELWWLVCFTNDIVNPFEDIYPGKILKIFNKNYFNIIMSELKEIYKL